MRQDYQYVNQVTIDQHNRLSRRRGKKLLLTGASGATFASGLWAAGISLLGLLAIVNIVQKKKPAIERRSL